MVGVVKLKRSRYEMERTARLVVFDGRTGHRDRGNPRYARIARGPDPSALGLPASSSMMALLSRSMGRPVPPAGPSTKPEPVGSFLVWVNMLRKFQ
jgi:hypothetical protein